MRLCIFGKTLPAFCEETLAVRLVGGFPSSNSAREAWCDPGNESGHSGMLFPRGVE